jgi:hypothetical protein
MPANYVTALRCTTERHKTHKTDSARAVYLWHSPFMQPARVPESAVATATAAHSG